MICVKDKRIDNLTALYHLALGLEKWFPANNSPFAYGTRLCEEAGELVEALAQYDASPASKQHVVKEMKDVLQIIMGVLGVYQQTNTIPTDLTSFFHLPKQDASKDDIITISIAAGRLADAVNHAENQGVKQQKHEDSAGMRLTEAASFLITCIARFMQQYDLLELLEQEIQEDYLRFITKGLIKDEARYP